MEVWKIKRNFVWLNFEIKVKFELNVSRKAFVGFKWIEENDFYGFMFLLHIHALFLGWVMNWKHAKCETRVYDGLVIGKKVFFKKMG